MSEDQKPARPGLGAMIGGIRDRIADVFSGLGDFLRENPLPRLIGLGLVVVVALILVIVLLGRIPWAALGSSPPASPAAPSWDPAQPRPPMDDQSEQDQTGDLGAPLDRTLPADLDPFFTQPLLPPELLLFAAGEIRLSRGVQKSWSLEDIAPFWPSLEQVWRAALRQATHQEFLDRLDSPEP